MSWTLIESQTLGSSVASVTLGSGGTLPQTYKSLRLVVSARLDIGSDNGLYARFNGDSGANYARRQLYGTGASAASTSTSGQSREMIAVACYSTDTTATFGNSVATIPNYAGSAAKAWSVDGMNENNAATAYQLLVAGLWSGTSAIASIVITPASGNIVAGSSFTLYGLK